MKGVIVSVGVVLLVVFAVARLTRLTMLDKVTDALCLAVVNMLGRWPGVQGGFTYFITCAWCVSMWWGFVLAPIGYYFGDTPPFLIAAVALLASQYTGTAAQWLDPGRRAWAPQSDQ